MDLIQQPKEEDCCNSGCNPCIFDVYEEKLRKFKLGELNLEYNLKGNLKNCISDTSYSNFKLVSKEKHTENSYIMVFEYIEDNKISADNKNHLYYNSGQHFLLRSNKINFTRAYTPLLSENLEKLQFKILVKVYEDGLISKIFNRMKIGDETLWRGPYGDFKINYSYRNVLMIAQGTGIAPIYSVLFKMLRDENFESFIKLFYCCKNENEIFLRDEVYLLKKYWNFNYEVFLSESKVEKLKYNEVINERKLLKSDIEDYLNNKSNVWVLICGSENFSECICGYLKDFNKKDVFVF